MNKINELDVDEDKLRLLTDDDDSIQDRIFDFDIEMEERIRLVNEMNKSDDIFEIVTRLCTMYAFSRLRSLEIFLEEICMRTDIKLIYKLEIGICLCDSTTSDKHYKILFNLLDKNDDEEDILPIPCRIMYTKRLLMNEGVRGFGTLLLCAIINNDNLEIEYRYKIILGLENLSLGGIENEKGIICECIFSLCLEFMEHKENGTRYKILSIQNMYANCSAHTKGIEDKLNSNLLFFAEDVELDYDLRADAADVLLHYGSEEPTNYKSMAKDIIDNLGRRDGYVRSVYNNAENVHTTAIEDSANEVIEYLSQFKIRDDLDYDSIRSEIESTLSKQLKVLEKEHNSIITALNRIECDRALYGNCNNNLSTILVKVWNYILKQDEAEKDEIKKRVLEELLDMSGKCSTGYAYRLVNSLSGFGDFSIRISYEDQIAGNLAGRMNAKLRDIEDDDFKEKVMNEMTMLTDSRTIGDRQNFLQFFRKNLSFIRHDIWETFREDITDADFDFYMRKAIARYEGHSEAYSHLF